MHIMAAKLALVSFSLLLLLRVAAAEAGAPVAVCTVVRDEAAVLDEWLVFHLWQGVGHMYVYDDGSSDATAEVLAHYVRAGLVTHTPWPIQGTPSLRLDGNGDDDGTGAEVLCDAAYLRAHPDAANGCQLAAFDHCLGHYGQHHRWLLFVDVDEFGPCPPPAHDGASPFRGNSERVGASACQSGCMQESVSTFAWVCVCTPGA
jgi:hypothetical protein